MTVKKEKKNSQIKTLQESQALHGTRSLTEYTLVFRDTGCWFHSAVGEKAKKIKRLHVDGRATVIFTPGN